MNIMTAMNSNRTGRRYDRECLHERRAPGWAGSPLSRYRSRSRLAALLPDVQTAGFNFSRSAFRSTTRSNGSECRRRYRTGKRALTQSNACLVRCQYPRFEKIEWSATWGNSSNSWAVCPHMIGAKLEADLTRIRQNGLAWATENGTSGRTGIEVIWLRARTPTSPPGVGSSRSSHSARPCS